MHDFHLVSVIEQMLGMTALGNDAPVHFDRYAPLRVTLLFKQAEKADGGFQAECLAI